MATKRISIAPELLVRILNATRDGMGRPVIPVEIDKLFQVRKALYDPKRHEFEMEVESAAFDQHPGAENRLPQAFVIHIK